MYEASPSSLDSSNTLTRYHVGCVAIYFPPCLVGHWRVDFLIVDERNER
jgi:hypothetical protein